MTSGGLGRAFVALCVASLVFAGTTRPASARHADDSAGGALTSESPDSERSASRAAIVLVGELHEGEQLVLLLRELLGRQGVECDFSETARFDPDALFAEGETDAKVRVFVRLADAGRARLYFRGPSGKRFLLRTIALPSGLDEVGRELVGQVVESSVVTLLRSSSGLSRDEASAELARETGTTEKPPLPEAPLPPKKPQNSSEPSFTFSVALRYTAEWFGPDLELAHGPGLELGMGTRGSVRLRARVSGEWFFDQTLDAPELRAEVGTKPLRASVGVGVELAEKHVVAFGVGGGVDLSRVEPSASRDENVTPGEPQSNVVPVLRPELRYELGIGSFLVGASAFVDLSLVRTHYDLLEDDEPVRLGAPWTARPGGAIAVGAAW